MRAAARRIPAKDLKPEFEQDAISRRTQARPQIPDTVRLGRQSTTEAPLFVGIGCLRIVLLQGTAGSRSFRNVARGRFHPEPGGKAARDSDEDHC